jgi:hypothetical protein
MTIIGPILMAALMIAPALLAKYDNQDIKTIAVIDDSMLFYKSLPDSKYINALENEILLLEGKEPKRKFITCTLIKNPAVKINGEIETLEWEKP